MTNVLVLLVVRIFLFDSWIVVFDLAALTVPCMPHPRSVSASMRLVAGDERSCPSGGPDFCVPLQQQVAGFPVAGGRGSVRRRLLLLDFHLFLQVYMRVVCLVGCGVD